MQNTYNAALLLRNDITTVEVVFDDDHNRKAKPYTFVITKDMAKGLTRNASLIVPVSHNSLSGPGFKVVKVVRVHPEAKIDLNVEYHYTLVVGVVDTALLHTFRLSTNQIADRIRERQSTGARESLMLSLGLTSEDVATLQIANIDDDFDDVEDV